MHGLYPFSWADVVESILAEILAEDLSCKENNYMHALGYLVNMILHAYSYIAIHLHSYIHSYVHMLYLRTYMYVHSYSICGKATYVCKSALAPFIDTKLRAYIAIRCYLFIVTSSNLEHRCRFISTQVKLTHECT